MDVDTKPIDIDIDSCKFPKFYTSHETCLAAKNNNWIHTAEKNKGYRSFNSTIEMDIDILFHRTGLQKKKTYHYCVANLCNSILLSKIPTKNPRNDFYPIHFE